MNTNLTQAQLDENGELQYAIFLPALSSFYAAYVGQQRFGEYVDQDRIPSNFKHGVESLNYLDPDKGAFHYQWTLYSAGHAELDINKHCPKEDMIRNRDRTTSWVVGDSGGFQIGKGVWEGDWKDPNCPKAMKKRQQVLAWMDAYMDVGMVLDIPAWLTRSPKGQLATGITTYQEAVDGTRINNDYFIQHRNGNCKFLNVLQGENHTEADDWYEQMKDYCDPAKYPGRHFNGWAMGGQNMCDAHLTLKRIIALIYDGLLVEGVHDHMHFLGTSKLEWALLLTDIQRAVRKYHNPKFTITFDCASPFLATANGQVYITTETPNRGKWSYRMVPSVDNKKYAKDHRLFRDVVLNDGLFKTFDDSPISQGLKISDICVYGAGIPRTDLPEGTVLDSHNPEHWIEMPMQNKIGKVGKTSWDSFSYAIQMGHNVWMHVNAVQEANRQYDQGNVPNMLVASKVSGKKFRQYDRQYCREIIDDIFAAPDRKTAEKIIEQHAKYWNDIPGTRGAIGDKSINTTTTYQLFFEEPSTTDTSHSDEFSEQELDVLDELENEINKDSK